MVNISISFLLGFVNYYLQKDDIFMFTQQTIKTIDENNTKALELTHLLIEALSNGIDDAIDIVTNLEIVRDILRSNSAIFDV